MSKQQRLENYILSKKKLGEGAYGAVYLAHDEITKQPVAIKQISIEKFPKKLLDAVESEKDTLRSVKHPNIIKLHDIYQNKTKVFFVTEFCDGGDLAHFIEDNPIMKESLIKKIIYDLASGLAELHSKRIVHRDLKPANVLLSNKTDPTFKIADFGFAKFIDENTLSKTICGTILYLAPEIKKETGYDVKVDLWSLGVIWYELIYRRNPFSGSTTKYEFFNNLENGNIVYEDTKYSKECIQLMKKLLQVDPKKRISAKELLEDPYFFLINENNESLIQILKGEKDDLDSKMEKILSFHSEQMKTTTIIDNYMDQFN